MIVRIGRDVYMKKNKKKKEQAKKRRLLLSLLLLVGTGIFLGTSTYAWFTANQTVAVNPIDVNVATQSGLQISADGQNWKSILTTTDITSASGTYADAKNQLPTQMVPVSSAGIMNADGTMEMFLGEVSSDEDSGNFVLAATKGDWAKACRNFSRLLIRLAMQACKYPTEKGFSIYASAPNSNPSIFD